MPIISNSDLFDHKPTKRSRGQDRAPAQPPPEADEGSRIDAAFDSIALSTARIVGSGIVPLVLPTHYPPTGNKRENNIQLLETTARFFAMLAEAIEEKIETDEQLAVASEKFRGSFAETIRRVLGGEVLEH
jgi:hypothetical protein